MASGTVGREDPQRSSHVQHYFQFLGFLIGGGGGGTAGIDQRVRDYRLWPCVVYSHPTLPLVAVFKTGVGSRRRINPLVSSIGKIQPLIVHRDIKMAGTCLVFHFLQ